MIKLIIEDSGHFIDLPGISVRTPTEIDITRMNMDVVVSKLRGQGIKKYKIVSSETKKIEPKTSISTPIKEEYKGSLDLSNLENLMKEFLKQHSDRMDKIEEIIKGKINVSDTSDEISIKKKEENHEIEEYIPDIKVDSKEKVGKKF